MKPTGHIQLFHLCNGVIDVVLCNYGCTVVAIYTPDKNGQKKNVVAGFNDPEHYKMDHPYFGSTVGRYANRIAFGKFAIDENEYHLATNNEMNHLHGGVNGFHRKIWEAVQSENEIVFTYLSKDGEEGYPGNMNVTVSFSLTNNNELNINYTATTDISTIVNLTNHSYFNLSGFESPTIHHHLLKIYADKYTVKNENNIPSGEIETVLNTPYNFTNQKPIAKHIDLLVTDMGYDINYVLNNKAAEASLAAELYEPVSGRMLKVYTDQPGMQVYTSNWWDGSFVGEQNKAYTKHGAVALETQAFPNSPNQPHFPSTVLRPGQVFHSKTIYQFLVV